MKDIYEYPEPLIDLLLEKDYEQLTDSEKEYVSGWISAAEYRELRKTYHAVRKAEQPLNPIKPLPITKQRLLDAFDEKEKPSLGVQLLSIRIPLWQAAASIILLLGLVWLSLQAKTTEKAVTASIVDTVKVVSTQLVHDTIFIDNDDEVKDNPLPRKHRDALAYSEEVQTEPVDTYTAISMPASQVHVFPLNKKKEIENVGKSLRDDSIASKFGFYVMM